ncbi:MAG: alkaline ceramidase [Clostridia bacterium]|nr:alkaline ceramidase [Clostridia bacterium]
MKNNILLGFAEVDITPSSNVQTVGFNRKDNLSRGILHRLFAQISVWHSNEGMCCLVAIDHIGFMCRDANLLRDEIGNKLGITREKVMLCFSHTHSAPNISLEPEYFNFLCKQILFGVSEAEKNTSSIKAVWGMAEADIGLNRRNAHGILDRRVGVLKIVDTDTKQLRLLILRVTAHANVLLQDNFLISSDFFGVTRELLEEKYGCKVMITQGASGNVKPKYNGSLEALDNMAFAIRDAIATCVDSLKPNKINILSMFSQKETFFADVPTLERAKAISEEAMRENNIDGTQWLEEVARLHNENVKQQSVDIEIQYFIVDDGCFCGVANEIMCELAVNAVKASSSNFFYFGGYTNGCDGYLPTAEEYDKGGYEVLHSYLIYYVYHGRVMPLNCDTSDKLVKTVAENWSGKKWKYGCLRKNRV